MRFPDSKAWAEFVYNLLYPGILGSMIYDAAKLIRGTQALDWFYVTQICIVLLFVIDYMHMYFDLRLQLARSAWRTMIDGLIPIGFGVAYWSMRLEDFGRVFVAVAVVMFLIVIYPRPEGWRKWTYNLGKAIPFILSFVAAVVYALYGLLGAAYVVFMAGILLAYAIHVFWVTEIARKPGTART